MEKGPGYQDVSRPVAVIDSSDPQAVGPHHTAFERRDPCDFLRRVVSQLVALVVFLEDPYCVDPPKARYQATYASEHAEPGLSSSVRELRWIHRTDGCWCFDSDFGGGGAIDDDTLGDIVSKGAILFLRGVSVHVHVIVLLRCHVKFVPSWRLQVVEWSWTSDMSTS